MFNRSEILTKAWRDYRFQTKWRDSRAFDRVLFTVCLRHQWHCAKMDIAAATERAAEQARLTCASPAERRAADIKAELHGMEFSNFINWNRNSALRAELAGLHV